MTVRLRLQREGKKKRPFYHLVAIDQRAKRDGKPIELLGHYDPIPTKRVINLNLERVQYWMKQGAQLSETAAAVVKTALAEKPSEK